MLFQNGGALLPLKSQSHNTAGLAGALPLVNHILATLVGSDGNQAQHRHIRNTMAPTFGVPQTRSKFILCSTAYVWYCHLQPAAFTKLKMNRYMFTQQMLFLHLTTTLATQTHGMHRFYSSLFPTFGKENQLISMTTNIAMQIGCNTQVPTA